MRWAIESLAKRQSPPIQFEFIDIPIGSNYDPETKIM
jgi:hypothetical protein